MSVIYESRVATGLTQAELADMAKVTRRYIISLEKNIPLTPTDSVLLVLADLLGVTTESLKERYDKEYISKSEEVIESIRDLDIDYTEVVTNQYDFAAFRDFLSRASSLPMSHIKFSEYFRVNPAEISAYERKRCRTMPTSIHAALTSLGLSEMQIASIHVNTV